MLALGSKNIIWMSTSVSLYVVTSNLINPELFDQFPSKICSVIRGLISLIVLTFEKDR